MKSISADEKLSYHHYDTFELLSQYSSRSTENILGLEMFLHLDEAILRSLDQI